MKKYFFLSGLFFINLSVRSQASVTLNEVVVSEEEKKSVIDPNKSNTNTLDLVDAIYSRVSGAQIKSDFNGNKNIALRGRQSFSTQADTVIWDIDGLIFTAPPPLDINNVQYVEILKGLVATNNYGSQGGAGVIVVRTSVSNNKKGSNKNIWNASLPLTKAERDSIKQAKKKAKAARKAARAAGKRIIKDEGGGAMCGGACSGSGKQAD